MKKLKSWKNYFEKNKTSPLLKTPEKTFTFEGAGCFLFIVNFKKYILFNNGCFKAEELVKNLDIVGR